jgi:hypothetical protein
MTVLTIPDYSSYIPLLDLVAKLQLQTGASVSFSVGRFTSQPSDLSPGLKEFFASGEASVYEELGWIDVHYPCSGHIKALLRMNIPEEFHTREQLQNIIRILFNILSIPTDETYVAYYFTVDSLPCILHAIDQSGTPGQFYV